MSKKMKKREIKRYNRDTEEVILAEAFLIQSTSNAHLHLRAQVDTDLDLDRMQREQSVRPGDQVVASHLSMMPSEYTAGAVMLQRLVVAWAWRKRAR